LNGGLVCPATNLKAFETKSSAGNKQRHSCGETPPEIYRSPFNCNFSSTFGPGCRVPLDGFGVTRAMSAELRSSGMAGLVPRPKVCTCAGFQTPAMRRSHIAGPASGSRQGRNPRMLSTRRCGRFYEEWDMASHGRRGADISNPHRKGRCSHARKDSAYPPGPWGLTGRRDLG
jgi:hypothetical protein